MPENPPEDAQVTGRTSWDFATEVLRVIQRVGPSAIVVGGFLVFGYFFYIEVTKARREADAQLQADLAAARKELVDTYTGMGSMNDQLIGNIKELIELQSHIDENVEQAKAQAEIELEAVKAETDKAWAEAEKVRADLARLKTDLKERQDEAGQLQAKIEDVKVLKDQHQEQVDDLIGQIAGLRQENEQLKAANSRLTALLERASSDPAPGGEPLITAAGERAGTSVDLERVLRDFASSPEGMAPGDFDVLIGMDVREFEPLIEGDLGYHGWVKLSGGASYAAFVGFVRQDEHGLEQLLNVEVVNDRISNVQALDYALVLALPKESNWYEEWRVLIVAGVGDEYIEDEYLEGSYTGWSLKSFGAHLDDTMSSVLLAGDEIEHRVLDRAAFAALRPDDYQAWSQRYNWRQRPGLILDMIHRADAFSSASIAGIDVASFPEGLKPVFQHILSAAVRREAVPAELSPVLKVSDLGAIAALALRDGVSVQYVEQNSFTNRGGEEFTTADVVMSFDGTDGPDDVREARIGFESRAGRWVLTSFTARL